jgi:hypothetical protein
MNRFVFATALIWAAPAFADVRYFTQIEDVPIAPGLAETGDRYEFADAGARIIGASAEGRAEAEEARAFYQSALPALGWALSVGSGGENANVFVRGREQLSLSLHQRGEELLLEVQLFIRPAPGN